MDLQDEEITRRRSRECPRGENESHMALAAGGNLEEHEETEENEDPDEIGRQRPPDDVTASAGPRDDVTATAAAPTRASGHVVDYPIIHPSQTRFACPEATCRLTYPSHASLVRHCEYTHENKRSTSLHFRHAHGVAVPPAPVEGSNEKACPYCPSTFPSSNSCSKHIREKHMTEVCAQRAREAAEKEIEPGTSTARTKWTQREIQGGVDKTFHHKGVQEACQRKVACHCRPTIPVSIINITIWDTNRSQIAYTCIPNRAGVLQGPVQKKRSEHRLRRPYLSLLKVGTAKVQRLDQLLRALRTRTSVDSTPPPMDMAIRIPENRDEQPLPPTPSTPPPPAPLCTASVLGIQELHNKTLDTPVSCGIAITPWDPGFSSPPTDLTTPTLTPPLATVSERQHYSPGAGVTSHPQSPSAPILPASTATPPMALPLALDTERQRLSQGEGVDLLMLTSPSSPEETPVPPPAPSVFQSLLHVPPFIPAAEWASTMVQRLDQALQSMRGGEAPDTSPLTTPPSSPRHAQPPATVSARQHCSLGVGMDPSQLRTTLPAVEGSTRPPPPSSPSQPRVAGVSGPLARITIDPENMDQTLRLPFHNELLPFANRTLGEFEWVAFEGVPEQTTDGVSFAPFDFLSCTRKTVPSQV
ncbi:hypothetical protein EMCRGX_G005337 [Ephydatia muelleri]